MNNKDIKIGSNRSFGLVFFLVFFLVSISPVVNDEKLIVWSLIVSIIFLLLGLFNSKILTPLNKLWFKFGLFLGKVISPIVMLLIFFFVLTPIGLLMKLLNKDLLNKKFNHKESYWIDKTEPSSKMKNQY